MPTLFVVADEFSLMLADHPEYAELFDYVARKGRSFRIHILFASQTLDVGRIKDIDKNTSYRIGLKVASPSVSRQIIGVEDAFHIESGPEHKGVGFLVPDPGCDADQVPQHLRRRHLRPAADADSPLWCNRFRSRSCSPPGRSRPRRDTVDRRPTADDLDGLPPRKLSPPSAISWRTTARKAPRLWLPPLDESIPLDELLARAGCVRAAVALAARRDRPPVRRCAATRWSSTPRPPAANMRDPRRTQVGQDHRAADVHPVGGRAALAARRDVLLPGLRRRPAARRWRTWPTSAASPLRWSPSASGARSASSSSCCGPARHAATGTAMATGDDGYGEVFLVIDNLYAFSRDNTDTFNTRNPLLAKVTELVNTGLSYGIHVVITTPNWLEVPLAMRDGLGLRLELKLPDARDSNVRVVGALRRPADGVPADQPGRGLTMAAEHFLFAEPALRDIAVDQRPLPGPVARRRCGCCRPTWHPSRDRAAVLARRSGSSSASARRTSAPVSVDFADNPLLMVFGDSKSGKTTLLRHLIRTIRENSTAGPGGVHRDRPPAAPRRRTAVRRQRVHARTSTGSPRRCSGWPRCSRSAARRPGSSRSELSGWTYQSGPDGHTHYLIIDDVDQIPDAPAVSGPYVGQRPWTALIGLLSQASRSRTAGDRHRRGRPVRRTP